MATNLDVVRVARGYIGTPFHHQGRAPGHGLDCVGVYVCVARELGLDHYPLEVYPAMPQVDFVTGRFDQHHAKVELPVLGDIGLFATMPGFPDLGTHLAILSERGIIHADGRGRVHSTLETSWCAYWNKRLLGFYRYTGLEIVEDTQWPHSF